MPPLAQPPKVAPPPSQPVSPSRLGSAPSAPAQPPAHNPVRLPTQAHGSARTPAQAPDPARPPAQASVPVRPLAPGLARPPTQVQAQAPPSAPSPVLDRPPSTQKQPEKAKRSMSHQQQQQQQQIVTGTKRSAMAVDLPQAAVVGPFKPASSPAPKVDNVASIDISQELAQQPTAPVLGPLTFIRSAANGFMQSVGQTAPARSAEKPMVIPRAPPPVRPIGFATHPLPLRPEQPVPESAPTSNTTAKHAQRPAVQALVVQLPPPTSAAPVPPPIPVQHPASQSTLPPSPVQRTAPSQPVPSRSVSHKTLLPNFRPAPPSQASTHVSRPVPRGSTPHSSLLSRVDVEVNDKSPGPAAQAASPPSAPTAALSARISSAAPDTFSPAPISPTSIGVPSGVQPEALVVALGTSASSTPLLPSSAPTAPAVNSLKRPREVCPLPGAVQWTGSGGLLSRITSEEFAPSSLLGRITSSQGPLPPHHPAPPSPPPPPPAPRPAIVASTSLLGRIDANSLPLQKTDFTGPDTREASPHKAGGSLAKRMRLETGPSEADLELERLIRRGIALDKLVRVPLPPDPTYHGRG